MPGGLRGMAGDPKTFHVSLVVVPEVDGSALLGLHGALQFLDTLAACPVRFHVQTVLPDSVANHRLHGGVIIQNVLGIPIPVHCLTSQVDASDIVIIPSLFVPEPSEWPRHPYPDLTKWLLTLHDKGTRLCSACTGALLLAETGLLDGYAATQHWAFRQLFQQRFPKVDLQLEKVLLATGKGNQILMTGASAAWHDLVLHLIARYAGPVHAQVIAKFFLLSRHCEGQSPYIIFQENIDHGDRLIASTQDWLKANSHEPDAIEKAVTLSGLVARTFYRRFSQATDLSPIHYVQHLRVEKAKQALELGTATVEQISWQVGYEDPASFRRLFKRLTGMTPSAYRRKFKISQ